jgi:hypothetical protein
MPFPSISRSSLIVADSILPVFASQMEQLQQRLHQRVDQGVTKRCRLSWLTTSALVYEPKCEGRGRGEVAGSQPMSTAVHMDPN